MLELSHNSHFRFGYDREWFVARSLETQTWSVEYQSCTESPLDWREECLRAARLIRAGTAEPLFALLSGGIDSEVMVRSFHACGIEITPLIIRFSDDLNAHDIIYAVQLCRELGLKYEWLDLDIYHFYKRYAFDLADEYQVVNPRLLPVIWAMDQFTGYPVIGGGDPFLVRRGNRLPAQNFQEGVFSGQPDLDESEDTWDLWEKERSASWARYLLKNNRGGCPGFFNYTPEIVAAFLLDPLSDYYMRGERSADTSAIWKARLYGEHFHLKPRPKYHGFEGFRGFMRKEAKALRRRQPFYDGIARIPVQQLINDLLKNVGNSKYSK
jgi:hypothetical protein